MSTAYTQRVEIGAYYTDGVFVYEVVEIDPLGMVKLRDIAFDKDRDVGIDAFRRSYWRVK